VAYLLYRNYHLEKRWRAVCYCWQAMCDLAFALSLEEGEVKEDWKRTVDEQANFMRRFGAGPMTQQDISTYERALWKRGIPLLEEHRLHGH
jgi:hypothetical protein